MRQNGTSLLRSPFRCVFLVLLLCVLDFVLLGGRGGRAFNKMRQDRDIPISINFCLEISKGDVQMDHFTTPVTGSFSTVG